MLEQLRIYLRPPAFPGDEDKTFTASLLHVILWSLLVGICLYTFIATILSFIQPHMQPVAWLYALALGGLALALMAVTRRGYVRAATIAINLGLWIIMTVAAYSNGGVVAPAYGGYIVVIVCICLLVSWQWGLTAAVTSALAGAVFLLAADRLPAFTYSAGSVWSANVAYFFAVTMLLALALRAIRRASQRMRHEAIERLKTEQALSQSEQRFRAIFDSVNDAIFVQDLSDGRILDVNRKMCEMYGYTAEEARQLIIDDLSAARAPYTQREALAWMRKAASGEPQIFEWHAKDRSGRLFWVEVNMRRAVIDGQDRLLVVVRDIDERKRVEATLQREKRFAEDIINSLPGIFYMVNQDGRLVRWNRLCEIVSGYGIAEVTGKSILDFFAGDSRERVAAHIAQAMEEGATAVEAELMTKGGQQLPYYLMGVRTELDDQTYLVGFGIDISVRRQAEREARQREAYLRSILDNFPYLVWLKDASGRFLAVNEAYAKACHQPSAEAVVGKTDLDVWPRELAEKYRADDRSVMEARAQKSVEEIVVAEGVERWFETYKSPIFDVQGNVIGTTGFAHDITDRKQAAERERRIGQGLRTVIEAAQELIDCVDLDMLYRRSVELAREKLGLERCGLFLVDEQAQCLIGTYGTDGQGHTTDERQVRDPILPERRGELFAPRDGWWSRFSGPQRHWEGGTPQYLPQSGWIVATPIRSRQRTIGVLYNDTAITHAPIDEAQQDIVAVYCSLLGSLFELKRAEADLAHERDLLQSLMDNSADTIYFKDTASRFTRINRAQAALLGLADPKDAIGKTDADFFQSGELRQLFLAEEQRLMSDGEPIIDRVEYNPRPDGQPRWLSASKVPLRDAAGLIVGLVGISRDITDRMLAEQREKTISQGLRAVIAATQELIDCADVDALYRRGVELAREKLGLERCGLFLLGADDTLYGTYGTDMNRQTTDERITRFPPAERADVNAPREQLWTVLQSEQTYWDGVQRRMVNTGWIAATPIRSYRQNIGMLYNDTAITHAPLDRAQQEVTAVYCSLLGSLIELKSTEAKLAQERDLLQALMDNFPDTIYFKDTASRFTRINQAQARMLGVTAPEEAIGKTDADFFQNSELNQLFLAEEQHLMTSGEALIDRLEYNPTREGQPRWLTASKVPLRDADGQITGMVGISRDVTDRILAQRRDQTISQGLRAVIEAADELMSCADLDMLYRRAVELAREKLKIERCGLFLLDEQGWLWGTYGTDLQGNTSDERRAYFQPTVAGWLNATPSSSWTIAESEQAYWEGDQHQVFGTGWVGTTVIRPRDRVLGVLYNDTAITRAPVDNAQQEVLAVYCSLLGSLIELKRAEEALRESESTTRALLDAIPDAIFRFDAQGIFKDFIPAKNFAPLVPPSVFIGQPYAQVLPPEVAQPLADNFQLVLEKGESRLFEYTMTADGQIRYYESRLVKMAQGDVLGIVRDVTDRKEAEQALQQREAYLRAILDNFPYRFWLKDTEGRYLAANRTLAHTLGLDTVEELIGKTDWDITPTVAAKHRADDQEVIDTRTQKLIEETATDHGEERWFETFKSPIFDAQGGVLGTAGFSHDITARRQAEAAIRQSEALFRSLADNAPAFISMTDAAGVATYLNHAWREFRGDLSAMLADEWAERVHPDDRRRYLHEFRSALRSQRKFTTEYRLRRVDGQYRWLLDTMVPHYAADERFAGFIGLAIDITDRKNAEEALRHSEGRLRLLTDNMVDIISRIDAQHRVVYASPSAERVFGHALRDLLGHPLYEFVHPEDASRLYHQMLMAVELHVPSLRPEYRYRHAAGHYLWVESEVRLLYDEQGEFASAVFGSRDVSVRKQIEIEREDLIRELEEKNAELGRFTYTVSHDLKSPLITIRGFLGFLEKDAVTGNLDRLRADIQRIAEATTRMQRLLDELLELSRIGRISNPPEEVPFSHLAREAVELVQGRIMARGVQVDIADNLPAVYGDRMRMIEVVQNLVDNAVKFMGDQPEPRISIGALGVERSGMSIFFVRDNGQGIEPEYHERIFGLFNKLDAKSEGTGVGLALVKRIIDLHGGHIWVESDGAGHGSMFYFTLPRRVAPDAKPA
jgi:PAS domain S-box-containing protein